MIQGTGQGSKAISTTVGDGSCTLARKSGGDQQVESLGTLLIPGLGLRLPYGSFSTATASRHSHLAEVSPNSLEVHRSSVM